MKELVSLIIEFPSLDYSYKFCIWKLHIDFQREDKLAVPKAEKSTENSSNTVLGLRVWTCLCAESTEWEKMWTLKERKKYREEIKKVKTREKKEKIGTEEKE